MSGRARALAEALRAPLLLSPLADSLAGWHLVTALGDRAAVEPLPRALLAAGLCGCCLLAAGMAQNAWLDLEDDRARKPERPLPRGDLSLGTVRTSWALLTLAALGLALWQRPLLPLVVAIAALTAAYHLLLKAWRLPGSLALGGLRAGSMALGAAAAGGLAQPWLLTAGCGTYGLYIAGASWHAAGDDRPGARVGWAGLSLSLASLVAVGLVAWTPLREAPAWQALGASGLAAWAVARLVRSARQHPPPRVTGVALSGLHLVHASLLLGLGRPLACLVVLLLFAASRRLLRVFPPS